MDSVYSKCLSIEHISHCCHMSLYEKSKGLFYVFILNKLYTRYVILQFSFNVSKLVHAGFRSSFSVSVV